MADIADKSVKVEKGDESIVEGNVYVHKDTKVEVTPYFVDLAAAHVQFNTLGRGDERRMRTDEFLATYKDTGGNASPTTSEKLKKKDA